MPDSTPTAVPWQVACWYKIEVANPNLHDRNVCPKIRYAFGKVHVCQERTEALSMRQALERNPVEWVPAEAVEWGVDEPWRPAWAG